MTHSGRESGCVGYCRLTSEKIPVLRSPCIPGPYQPMRADHPVRHRCSPLLKSLPARTNYSVTMSPKQNTDGRVFEKRDRCGGGIEQRQAEWESTGMKGSLEYGYFSAGFFIAASSAAAYFQTVPVPPIRKSSMSEPSRGRTAIDWQVSAMTS